jgi:hypothetical protein
MLVYFMAIWSIFMHLIYFMALWYILWSFGLFFPVFVHCTTENLATMNSFLFSQFD